MKHVVITGAASGIGWALALKYWQQGYIVHLVDRDEVALKARMCELPERTFIYAVDLLDDRARAAFCQQLLIKGIPIYRLINNAGITHRSPASKTQPEVFNRVMKLNWQVPVELSQTLLPALAMDGGKIINMASMAALMPVPGRAAYCASKAAITQHFETWRPELLNIGVDVLMVFPSFVQTSIESNALGLDGNPAKHPQSKIGKQIGPEQMAEQIIDADFAGKQRFMSNALAPRFGYWIWVRWPWLFQKISWRKFSGELS